MLHQLPLNFVKELLMWSIRQSATELPSPRRIPVLRSSIPHFNSCKCIKVFLAGLCAFSSPDWLLHTSRLTHKKPPGVFVRLARGMGGIENLNFLLKRHPNSLKSQKVARLSKSNHVCLILNRTHYKDPGLILNENTFPVQDSCTGDDVKSLSLLPIVNSDCFLFVFCSSRVLKIKRKK